ncbi:MAG: thioredoxin-dependent thiol peroxidase [Deltaproteobacteria bacterium]
MAAKKKAQRAGSVATRARSSAASKGASAPRGSAKSGKKKATARAEPVRQSVTRAATKAAAPARVAAPARKSAAAPPTRSPGTVGEGDGAPSFALPDQSGAQVSSGALAGQPYVLYFYPKDDTPGCTTQACGFRDALPAFEKLGVRVIGVSPDSSASHERFRTKYELPFTLLSDADKQLSTAYGAWALKKNYGREYMGVVRSTFLVDSEGVIRNVWRGVKVNGHVEKVQAAAGALG